MSNPQQSGFTAQQPGFNPQQPGLNPQQPDRICLTGLKIHGHHGVFAHEKETGQDFYIDVVLHTDTRPAAASDDLADTIDYGALADDLATIVGTGSFDLIETLAEALAEHCLTLSSAVEVTVHKPAAPIAREFSDVAVRVVRDRAAASGAASGAGVAGDEGAVSNGTALVGDGGAASGAPGAGDVTTTEAAAEPALSTAVLGLGANLGDAPAQLGLAIESLDRHPRISVSAVSSLYQTAPVGGVEQPDFYNACATVTTSLPAVELLAVCQGIEVAAGRTRDIRWGPRTLDIDLLDYRDSSGQRLLSATEVLTLPHPRAAERGFVLVPWAELEPTTRLGELNLAQAAAHTSASDVRPAGHVPHGLDDELNTPGQDGTS